MATGEQLSLASVDRDIIYAEGLFKELSDSKDFEQQIQTAPVEWLFEATAQLISELSVDSNHIDQDKLDQLSKINDEIGKRHQAVA